MESGGKEIDRFRAAGQDPLKGEWFHPWQEAKRMLLRADLAQSLGRFDSSGRFLGPY